MKRTKSLGFTLIELLIVVAIIAILAAIAVPNFLEAQMRARVSRCKGEFRSVATALESYCVDYSHYPASYAVGFAVAAEQIEWSLKVLTTPVAYMTSARLISPFSTNFLTRGDPNNTRPIYMYINYEQIDTLENGDNTAAVKTRPDVADDIDHKAFMMWAAGPDQNDNTLYWADWVHPSLYPVFTTLVYDPTNGTISNGDIGRMGGEVRNHYVSN